MRILFEKLFPAFVGAIIWGCAGAFASAQSLSYNDVIAAPEGMVEKKLANGLGYSIMYNNSPSRMIEFRLIFNTGSVMETEQNRGAAHFLEHMAFGGTRHFPERKLVEYLESLGAQYGIGINAFTGYDRTIYMFTIPSDEAENIDKALLIIKDWLTDITLDNKKVEGEKGIILEELRGYDIGDDFYDLKIGSGEYAGGIPLGNEEQIKRMSAKTLRDFHSMWYTLDRATVAVVGDVDVEDVEARIVRMFGRMKGSKSPDVRQIPLEYAEGTFVKGVEDTLARRMTMDVMVPHKALMKTTLGDAVNECKRQLLVRAISARFYALGYGVSVSNSWYLADKEHFVLSASAGDKVSLGMKIHSAVAELYRIAEDGFCDAELDAVKKKFTCVPRPSDSSAELCDDIAEAVLLGDRRITRRSQKEFVEEAVAGTESAELQSILVSWLEDAERTRLVAYRYNPYDTDGFTHAQIDSLWSSAESSQLSDYEYEEEEDEWVEQPRTIIPAHLLSVPAYDASMVEKKVFHRNIGVTDVFLANGFRFILRPTLDADDKIQLQLFAPGGLSVIPEDQYAYYEDMGGYMELGGVACLEDDAYFSIMAENGIGQLLAIESYWHGLIASAPSSSLKLMLNLMYEKMTAPRLNYESFEEIKNDELEDYGEESYLSRLMKTDVQRQLGMQIDSLMGNLVYGRKTELTKEEMKTLNLDMIATKYREMFANPRGMTCVVCGAFDVDDFLQAAVPVFGRMVPGERPNMVGKSHFTLPVTTRKIEYPNENETQTIFDYLRFGQYQPSLRSGLMLKLMNGLIRNKLLTVLREQESLVYSPYTALFYTANPDKIFYIDINASVDRNNASKVHRVLDDIILDLQTNKVSQKELNTLKKIFIVNKRTYLEEDATSNWKNYLVGQIKNDETLVELDSYEDVLYSITAEELRREFIRCFDTDRYMILSIGPF